MDAALRRICTACASLILATWSATTIPASPEPVPAESSTELQNPTAECRPPRIEYEDLVLSWDPGEFTWKVGHHEDKRPFLRFTEYIREGDDIKNWRELLTLTNFGTSWGLATPEQSLDAYKAGMDRRCPGVMRWNVIETKSDSILYEWQATPCQGWPDQHEIAKIIYGKHNRFMVRYTVKQYELPSDTRARWVRRFAESKLVLRCR